MRWLSAVSDRRSTESAQEPQSASTSDGKGVGFAPSAGESLVLQADVDVDLYRGLRAR
jgi:hypothetical protein